MRTAPTSRKLKPPVPLAELQEFFARCEPAEQSDRLDVVKYLRDRFGSLEPLRSEVRIAPTELGGLPKWCQALARTHPIILRLYDVAGQVVSVQGRLSRAPEKGESKTRNPAGYRLGGSVFANGGARDLFLGRSCSDRVIVVEGLADFLATLGREPSGAALIGIVSGSTRVLGDVQWPDDVEILIATDDDAAGDRYAAEIGAVLPRLADVRRLRCGRGKDVGDLADEEYEAAKSAAEPLTLTVDAWSEEDRSADPEPKSSVPLERRIQLARGALREIGPAVEGERGRWRLYRACLHVRRGCQVPYRDALPLLLEYNTKCLPPFEAFEVEETLADAEDGRSQWGFLLPEKDRPWESPIPLPSDAPPPPFPLEALPRWVRNFAAGLAENIQIPVDFVAMVLLGVLSAALSGKYVVHVRDSWNGVELMIYVLVVLRVSERKTPAVTACVEPLRRFELDRQAEMQERINSAERKVEITDVLRKGALERLKRESSKTDRGAARAGSARSSEQEDYTEGTGSDAASASVEDPADGEVAPLLARLQDAVEAATERHEETKRSVPTPPRILAEYATPEALVGVLAENLGRLALISDEAAGFFDIVGGRYSDRAEANVDLFLKGKDGGSFRDDRVGRGSQTIPQVRLSVAMSAQPVVLENLGRSPALRSRGLMGRFLFAVPRSRVGRRKSRPKPLSLEVKRAYERGVRELLELQDSLSEDEKRLEPKVLRFSRAADDTLAAFQDRVEAELGGLGELEEIGDWAGKLHGNVAALAGILHISRDANNPVAAEEMPVEVECVAAAIKIAEYCIPHARMALGIIHRDGRTDAAKRLLSWIKRNGAPEFTRREVHQGLRGSQEFQHPESLDPPLDLLESHEYLRRRRPPRTRKAGRPKVIYDVNPAVFAAADGGSQGTRRPVLEDSEDSSQQFATVSSNAGESDPSGEEDDQNGTEGVPDSFREGEVL